AWLAWVLGRWNSALTQMRGVLSVRPLEDLPTVPTFHERELDDIGTAINTLSEDLRASKARTATLTTRLTSAERLAALGRVSAALAHEIRNPLATIRLRAENALAGESAGPAQTQTLNRIMEEVDRLERLVRSLLELGREIRLQPTVVNLAEWLEPLVASAQARASANDVTIVPEIRAERWSFDSVHLGRVVDGLLSNALAFAPAGSEIGLTMQVLEDHLVVTVRDAGPGIPADIEARVFDPFFTTRPGGAGLGLALARETVEAHGGEIRVLSQRPGTSIELRIPWLASS
ncbi:sensor histidine kinase, partial [Steroidobacter sp.]|uniref:sensor histidine kinase n=1 Tax=Steroidobacter sp. TaxID=1978227 RepID=UPI001A4AC940